MTKIGIISESPTLTTGFGTTSKQIALGLCSAGYEVAVFGIGAIGETFDRSKYPYTIWTVGYVQPYKMLPQFFEFERPDIIIINYDIIALDSWFKICRSVGWTGPCIAHFVIDGIPIDRNYLSVLKEVDATITPTHTVEKYLKNLGVYNIEVAPHCVDLTTFLPQPNRDHLRNSCGLHDKFLIGVFGRNTARKQQPRVLLALEYLKKKGLTENILAYFHCQQQDIPDLGGWNLASVAEFLDVENLVLFPDKTFKQLQGVPLKRSFKSNNTRLRFPDDLSYVERLSCCDVIVNVPFCGGFELILLEAQACEVPVISSDDDGIMKEVLGSGGIGIKPRDYGIWHTGAKQHFIHPQDIADAVMTLMNNSQLKCQLVQSGKANVQRYAENHLGKACVKVVQKIEGGNHVTNR